MVKCSKILFSKISNKMANASSVVPDQEQSDQSLQYLPLQNNCIKSKI